MPAYNNHHNHGGHSTNNCENKVDVDVESTSTSRIRVIPGSSLSLLTPPPPPPTSPPPKPSHLCKIAVVGDAYSGKTAFIQKFIHRRYANNNINHNDGEEKFSNNGGMHYTTASATSNSLGTSLGGLSSYDGLGFESTSSLAEYHKKDVTIYWNNPNNNIDNADQAKQQQQQQQQHESAQRNEDGSKKTPLIDRKKPVCIRVQLWDMNIHHYFTTTTINNHQNNENDEPDSNNSVYSETPSCHSLAKRSYFATLLPLLKRIHGVVIVCRCPLPPSTLSSSPSSSASLSSTIPTPQSPNNNASYALNYDATCASDRWPEFEAVKEQIQRWTSFLHDRLLNGSSNSNQNQQQQQHRSSQPIVFVSLSCADLVVARYSPREWVELTSRMQDICKECGVDSWSMNSCMDSIGSGSSSGSSADDENNDSREKQQQQQSVLLQRLMQQQKRMLEDMEDATEAALIEMISMHLR